MRPLETTTALVAFDGRGPGTDAERRAARWLAGELVAARHRVRIETFWCRPNWALAHAWHVALALAGSLISVGDPLIGTVILAVALTSTVADDLLGTSIGRRLTPERASQNVVATTPSTAPTNGSRLIVTANYDAGRAALIYRDPLRAGAGSSAVARGGRRGLRPGCGRQRDGRGGRDRAHGGPRGRSSPQPERRARAPGRRREPGPRTSRLPPRPQARPQGNEHGGARDRRLRRGPTGLVDQRRNPTRSTQPRSPERSTSRKSS